MINNLDTELEKINRELKSKEISIPLRPLEACRIVSENTAIPLRILQNLQNSVVEEF